MRQIQHHGMQIRQQGANIQQTVERQTQRQVSFQDQKSIGVQRQTRHDVSFQQQQSTEQVRAVEGALAEHLQSFEKELDSFQKRDGPPTPQSTSQYQTTRVDRTVHRTVSQSEYETEPTTPIYYNGTDDVRYI